MNWKTATMNTRLVNGFVWLLSLTSILVITGCSSVSGNGAYSLKLTQMNVDWKMTAYREASAAGNLILGQQQRVTAAYQAYQSAFKQALGAAHSNLESPAPANVRQLATELIGLIDSLN
jgi:hypothetical protein